MKMKLIAVLLALSVTAVSPAVVFAAESTVSETSGDSGNKKDEPPKEDKKEEDKKEEPPKEDKKEDDTKEEDKKDDGSSGDQSSSDDKKEESGGGKDDKPSSDSHEEETDSDPEDVSDSEEDEDEEEPEDEKKTEEDDEDEIAARKKARRTRSCKVEWFGDGDVIEELSVYDETSEFVSEGFCHKASELGGEEELIYLTHHSTQGMCIADGYVVYANFNGDDKNTNFMVVNMKTGKLVCRTTAFAFHANSLTYNPDRHEIVCASDYHAYVYSFRGGRMDLKADHVIDHNCRKITYVSSKKCYYLASGSTVYKTKNFSKLKAVFRFKQEWTGQGMACDGQYIYIVSFKTGKSYINKYTLSGKHVQTYTFTSSRLKEMEEVDFHNGNMYFNVVQGGSRNGIYKIESTHQITDWEIDEFATCGTPGKRERSCRICKTKQTEIIPVTGNHIYGHRETKIRPTCTTYGEAVKYCIRCDAPYDLEILEPTGHDYSPWSEVKEPTALKKGKKVQTCSICGYVHSRATACLEASVTFNEPMYVTIGHSEVMEPELISDDYIVACRPADGRIAQVTKDGTVTGTGDGNTRIHVTTAAGASGECEVIVRLFDSTGIRIDGDGKTPFETAEAGE